MTVGETLTEARNHAGLSVDELSERTRIRETVIRSIERDDYEACGGDLYVRGYVRALAGAVGIDAQPLIREFDQDRASGHERASGSTGRHALGYPLAGEPAPAGTALEAAATSFDLPAVTAAPAARAGGAGGAGTADPDATRFDLPPVTADPDATRFDLPVVAPRPRPAAPLAAEPPTGDLMAAGYDLTPPPGTAPGPRPAPAPARRPRRRALIGAAVVVVLLVATGALAVSLSPRGGGQAAPARCVDEKITSFVPGRKNAHVVAPAPLDTGMGRGSDTVTGRRKMRSHPGVAPGGVACA